MDENEPYVFDPKYRKSAGENKCCVCEKKLNKKDRETHKKRPLRCYKFHRPRHHKMCETCWFGPDGFANEASHHACPGCLKRFPLCYPPHNTAKRKSRRKSKSSPPPLIEVSDSEEEKKKKKKKRTRKEMNE